MTQSAQINRAPRFPLQVPIHYRKSGMRNWHDGRTLNISRTGVLFHTDENLTTNLQLEIRISLPHNTILSCQGIVVREEPTISTKTIKGLAARLSHCRLLNPEKAREQLN